MKTTLIIGYGNPDRQDDGAALHILVQLASLLNRPLGTPIEDSFYPQGLNPDLWFNLQLLPEMAETASRYERLCFIDAHTGHVPQDLQIAPVNASFQLSPLTHHMTPSTFMSLCQALRQPPPQGLLVSVRGYQFGFDRSLSPETELLVKGASAAIYAWITGE